MKCSGKFERLSEAHFIKPRTVKEHKYTIKICHTDIYRKFILGIGCLLTCLQQALEMLLYIS